MPEGNDPIVTYAIGNGSLVRIMPNEDGVYTVPGNVILGDVTLRANVAIPAEIALFNYAGAPNGYKLALIAVESPVPALTYTIDDAPLYWSASYPPETGRGCYAYIVPAQWTEQDVRGRLTYRMEETSGNTHISYDGDVNRNGTTNIKDAQIAYDLYNENADYLGDKNLTLLFMLQRLEADVNADRTISMLDVRAVYNRMTAQ